MVVQKGGGYVEVYIEKGNINLDYTRFLNSRRHPMNTFPKYLLFSRALNLLSPYRRNSTSVSPHRAFTQHFQS